MGYSEVSALKSRKAQLIEDAKRISTKRGFTDADEAKVNAILAQVDSVQIEIEGAEVGYTWVDSGKGEGFAQVDSQSWREVKVSGLNYRYHVPVCVEGKGYDSAFEAYLRMGGDVDRLGPSDRKALSVGIDANFGYAVPGDFQASVIKKLIGSVAIRRLSRNVQISSDHAVWPRIVDDSPADDVYSSLYRAAWLDGETPIAGSFHNVIDANLGVFNVPVHTLMASTFLTNTLVEDGAIDAVGFASDLLSDAAILAENSAFVNGSGIGRPQGVLFQPNAVNGPATIKSGAAVTLTAAGAQDFVLGVPSQYIGQSAVVMNAATFLAGRKLDKSVFYYSDGNPMLEYAPVHFDAFVPDIAGGANVAIGGDWKTAFLVVDRVMLSVRVLRELAAESDMTTVIMRHRVGSQVVVPNALKIHRVEA